MTLQIQKNSTGFFNPTSLRWVALVAAVLSMGVAMPSCPGQDVKDEVVTLQNSQSGMTTKVQSMDNQIRMLNQEVTQQKQIISQMADAIQKQMAALNQLNTSLQQLNQQVMAISPKSRKGGRSSPSTTRRKGK